MANIGGQLASQEANSAKRARNMAMAVSKKRARLIKSAPQFRAHTVTNKRAGLSKRRSTAERLTQLIKKLAGEGDTEGAAKAKGQLKKLKQVKKQHQLRKLQQLQKLKAVEKQIDSTKELKEKTEFKLIRLSRIRDQRQMTAYLKSEKAKDEAYKAHEDSRKFRLMANYAAPEEAARLRAKADQIMARVETFKSAARVAESNAKAASAKTKSVELCQESIDSRLVVLKDNRKQTLPTLAPRPLVKRNSPGSEDSEILTPEIGEEEPVLKSERQQQEFPEGASLKDKRDQPKEFPDQDQHRQQRPEGHTLPERAEKSRQPAQAPLSKEAESTLPPVAKLRNKIKRLLRTADVSQEKALRQFLLARAEVHKKDLAFLAADGLSKRSGTALKSVGKAFEKFAQQDEVRGV